MIHIEDKSLCCGCSACVARCSRGCIRMEEDSEGFSYPVVDASRCTDCGLCEQVCPELHPAPSRSPLSVYAAVNPDESVRLSSSSGGLFSLLAEDVIASGGIVFGAGYDEHWEVCHKPAETSSELSELRGSKYVQSRMGDTFRSVGAALRQGRRVLFCGTPCQVSSLRRYLRRDYDGLLLVDFICHGVPSPGVFRAYLREELAESAREGAKYSFALHPIPSVSEGDTLLRRSGMRIESMSFRDKRKGWKKYSFALTLSKASAAGEKNSVSLSYTLHEHAWLRGFLADLYLRPSCYRCAFKCQSSGSDVTLGDFWGIHTLQPELDDDKGISAVVVNTAKGEAALSATSARLHPVNYEALCQRNPALVRSCRQPEGRARFYKSDGRSFHWKVEVLCRPTLRARLRVWVSRLIPRPLKHPLKRLLKRLMGR